MNGSILRQDGLHDLIKFQKVIDGSDAEVVLHAYEELGTCVFGHLEGELALACGWRSCASSGNWTYLIYLRRRQEYV